MTKLLTRPNVEMPPAFETPVTAPPPPSARRRTREPLVRPALAPPPQPPSARQIRDRAYFLYLERGGAQGDAAYDWLQAERELWTDYRRALDAYMRQAANRPNA